MKIVDVCESYSPHGGGVRTYVHHKLAASAKAGHETVIVAPGSQDREERHPGGRIVFVKSVTSPFDRRYGLFVRERDIHRVLDQEQPDVIEGSSPWGGGYFAASWPGSALRAMVFHTDVVAVWGQTLLGARIGFARTDGLFRPYWSKLRQLCTRYDATVVSGTWLAQRLAFFGICNTEVVPFGIDKVRFSPDKRSPAIRKRLLEACGADQDALIVLIAGRLDPEKRVGTLIEAFRRAAIQRPLALVVVGRGALERWYRRRVESTSGACMVGYVDEREDMAGILASADVLLHGSAAETYGLVVAEAIASGLPVVVPHLGGAAALANPACSEIYRAGDPKDCERALLRLLSRDPVQLRNGCATASEAIGTMDQHFRRLFEFYEQLRRRHGERGSQSPPGRAA